MDHIILYKNKPNNISFHIKIEGTPFGNTVVKLCVMLGEQVYITFPCTLSSEPDVYTATIENELLPNRSESLFFLEVISDDFYFKPIQGTVTIVDEPKITTTIIPNPAEHPNVPTPTLSVGVNSTEEPIAPQHTTVVINDQSDDYKFFESLGQSKTKNEKIKEVLTELGVKSPRKIRAIPPLRIKK